MQFKYYLFISVLFSILISCGQTSDSKSPGISKQWLNKEIDFNSIQEVVNTYHMFDSNQAKVGSMVYATAFNGTHLMALDTSQFDDGTVYETASFVFDTSSFTMKNVKIDMSTPNASLNVDFNNENNQVKGEFTLNRNEATQVFPLDSTYQMDIIRSEIYLLLQTLPITAGDTIALKALVPTRMGISSAEIYLEGEERISTALGEVECDVVWLKTDGIMPNNKIWISKDSPRKLIKFYVPGPELSIEIQSSKPYKI